MTFEDWTYEEQEEVKEFFRIEELEPELWPKLKDSVLSKSGILDDSEAGKNEGENGGSSGISVTANSVEASKGLVSLTESMRGAKLLLEESKDPLGINDSLYQMQVQRIILDPKYNNQLVVSLSSPPSIQLVSDDFDARLCLRLVHQYTSYEDLVRASEHLQFSIQTRKNVLKSLVRENFDRFVNAKNSIDSVYADMRSKGMNSGDYGMRPATASVNAALEKSQQVYHPLLKRRSREDCIRKRLSVFQEYKAIFNLPAALVQHVHLGEFQQCVFEYRRGRELLQAEPVTSTLRPILEQVWGLQVERAANDLRSCLFEKLGNPVFPHDVQSKIISYLLELEARPDPIIFYFSVKTSLLMRQCQRFQEEAVSAIQMNLAQPRASQLEDHVASLLRDTLRVLESQLYEKFTSLSYPTVREWKIIAESFGQLSGNFKTILQPMAKISGQIFDNRLNRLNPQLVKDAYPKKMEESIKLIVDSFHSNVDSVYTAVMGQTGHVDNSPVAMYFTLKIVKEMGEAFAYILDANPHAIMLNSLNSSFAYLVNSLLSRVWSTAVVDCRNLGIIEDWKLVGTSSSTALVRSFENLLRFLLQATISCRKVFLQVIQDDSSSFDPVGPIDQWFSKAFTEFVIEGMYRYVRQPNTSENEADCATNDSNEIESSSAPAGDLTVLNSIGTDDSIDLLKLNLPSRLLVVLANVSYLQGEGLKGLLTLLSAENVPISPDSMFSSLQQVERATTQLFLQGQIGRIIGPIESGWLKTIDSCERVSASASIFKSLLALSDVQALISDVIPKDPYPLLRDLTNSLLSCVLKTLKTNISVLNARGIIQARVDVEFLKRKLERTLLNSDAMELFDRIDKIFSTALHTVVDQDTFERSWNQFEADWSSSFANLFLF